MREIDKYSILIKWSAADNCYVASLPEFGDYAKTHGETYVAAMQNAIAVLKLLTATDGPLPPPDVYSTALDYANTRG